MKTTLAIIVCLVVLAVGQVNSINSYLIQQECVTPAPQYYKLQAPVWEFTVSPSAGFVAYPSFTQTITVDRPGTLQAIFTAHANTGGAAFSASFFADNASLGTSTPAGIVGVFRSVGIYGWAPVSLVQTARLTAGTHELDLRFDTNSNVPVAASEVTYIFTADAC